MPVKPLELHPGAENDYLQAWRSDRSGCSSPLVYFARGNRRSLAQNRANEQGRGRPNIYR
jgi:hypothetical protein